MAAQHALYFRHIIELAEPQVLSPPAAAAACRIPFACLRRRARPADAARAAVAV
jgi:hypothetical protein